LVVRKRSAINVPKTVKIVAKPKAEKVLDLKDIRRIEPRKAVRTPPAASVAQSKILRRHRNIRRKTQVRYETREPSYGSIEKIKALQGIGCGNILIILGNGPSLLEVSDIDLKNIKEHDKIHTLTVNKPDERIWPTTYWAFFDYSQLRRHEDLWNSYHGTMFNSTAIRKQKQSSMQFKNHRGQGWSKDPSKGIYIGRSSVYASMQIAAWMNYDHIYILGCDMNPSGIDGKLHFYGVNPDVEPELRAKRFAKEAEWYDTAAVVLSPEERTRFTFVTDYNPWDFVKKFGNITHRDLTPIIEHANRL